MLRNRVSLIQIGKSFPNNKFFSHTSSVSEYYKIWVVKEVLSRVGATKWGLGTRVDYSAGERFKSPERVISLSILLMYSSSDVLN